MSGRNSCHTPKSFLMAQCSGWGSQALNSPISASACEGEVGERALQQCAQHGKSPTCTLQRPRLCTRAAAHPAQAAADAGAPAQAATADGAPAQAAADAGVPAHLGTRCPLAVPDALLALVLAAVQAIEVVACRRPGVDDRCVSSCGARAHAALAAHKGRAVQHHRLATTRPQPRHAPRTLGELVQAALIGVNGRTDGLEHMPAVLQSNGRGGQADH